MNSRANQTGSSNPQTQAANAVGDILSRNARAISITLLVVAVPSVGLFVYYGLLINAWQILASATIMTVASLGAVAALFLIPRGRSNLAMMIVMTSFTITFTALPFLIQGLGVVLAILIFILMTSISGLAMSARYVIPGIILGLVSSVSIFLLDNVILDPQRLSVPELEKYTPYIVAGLTLFFVLFTFRQFNRFSLRIKIVLGILITGGITITAILIFGLGRAGIIVNTLAAKYEDSVIEKTERQVTQIAQAEADKANQLFEDAQHDMAGIANYRAGLELQKSLFGEGGYWNSNEKVFQLPDGQYTNAASDPASIFIPNLYAPGPDMFADLNTSAHLDFYVPAFLETHPEVVAVYYISSLGPTTYYPNIELAQILPADFDVLVQPFYTIADPKNNPEKSPRWTIPYQDPAGTGLIVTLSIPVYARNGIFKGVLGADLQLAEISENISNIRIGETGFAFLVDNEGRIIAMPERGYQLLGLQPEEIPISENPKQTILGIGEESLQSVTRQIVSGDTGLLKTQINGEETYVAFAPLGTADYRFALFAPANELNEDIVNSREEVREEISTSAQGAVIVLAILFAGILLISLWVGQLITRPLTRLTHVVEQVTAGNLFARASIETEDETGRLASSFNLMTERLNDTLATLEQRVLERTRDLENANQSNFRRASQFEAIARVARTISATQTLSDLLPQITVAISEQFDFYHVGIFLVDTQKEYAVLVAANSEGGKKMLNRNHRLLVGGTGIVGFVTNTGQPRVALDVGRDAAFFNNPDLPETHSEMALPLRIGTEVIGALDVQSTEINAFTQEDVSILSTLADQVSIAIQNARSYQQGQEALAQAEAASIRISGQQWKEFLTAQAFDSFVFDGIETRKLTFSNSPDAQSFSIPLTLRGTRIGTLKLSAPDSSRVWTEDEIAMAQAAAERTALAIESARLLQEAQKRAAKERAIGDISAKIGGLIDIESILQTAMRELGNTLTQTDIAIQFTSDELTGAGTGGNAPKADAAGDRQ